MRLVATLALAAGIGVAVAQSPAQDERAGARPVEEHQVAPPPSLRTRVVTQPPSPEATRATAAELRELVNRDLIVFAISETAGRGTSRRVHIGTGPVGRPPEAVMRSAVPAEGSQSAAQANAEDDSARPTKSINVPVDERLNTRVVNQTSSFRFVQINGDAASRVAPLNGSTTSPTAAGN